MKEATMNMSGETMTLCPVSMPANIVTSTGRGRPAALLLQRAQDGKYGLEIAATAEKAVLHLKKVQQTSISFSRHLHERGR